MARLAPGAPVTPGCFVLRNAPPAAAFCPPGQRPPGTPGTPVLSWNVGDRGAGHRGTPGSVVLGVPGRFGAGGARSPGRFGARGVPVTGVLWLPGVCSGRAVCCGLRCVPAVVMLRPPQGPTCRAAGPRPVVPRWCRGLLGPSCRGVAGLVLWCRVAGPASGWLGVWAVVLFWPAGSSACADGPVSYIPLCSGRLDCHDRHHRSRPRRYG